MNRGHPYVSEGGATATWAAILRRCLPGQVVAVYYSDDRLWHERLLLYPLGDGRTWIVRTPDADQYAEQVDAKDEGGCCRICMCSLDGSSPRLLYGRLYRFQNRWEDSDLVDMIRAAAGQAKALDPDGTSEPTHAVNSAGKKVVFRSLVPATLSMKKVVLGKSGLAMKSAMKKKGVTDSDSDDDDELDPGEDHVWVSLETIEGHLKKGQEVALVEGDVRVGDRAVHVLNSGDSVAVKRIPIEEASAADETEDALDLASDVRVLTPLQLNGAGRRWATFAGVVEKMVQEDMNDWPVEGDRSVNWLLGYIVQHGNMPEGRHTKWAMGQAIPKDSLGYTLHDLLGYVLELAVSYDQLDMPNLASMEVLGRLYQLLEETSGTMVVEGMEHYIGRSKTAGRKRGIALAPGLAKSVTNAMSTEVEILKQRRKAREEETAAREAAKGGRNPKGGQPKKEGG